jgi:tRNA(fMet)-specific endonuclease VapC
MRYLLDSSILIAIGLATDDAARRRLAQLDEGDAVTSVIAYAEVLYGSRRGKPPAMAHLAKIIEEVAVLPFDQAAASVYAGLFFKRASYDRLIAAHAIALGLTVATANVADFADIPGLSVEDWTR